MTAPVFLAGINGCHCGRRTRRRPTGYLVRFTIVSDIRENGWAGTGAGEAYAYSPKHLNAILRGLNQRMDLRAEVIPIWGPLATPSLASSHADHG